MKKDAAWRIVSVAELIIAIVVIALDLFVPTLVLLAVCAVTTLARGQGVRSLGFRRTERPLRMALIVFALTVGWTILQLGLTMPVLNHLTGTTQDLSGFEGLKGNVGSLAFLLLASWTLAALGEEIVYRGYLQVRTRDIVGRGLLGVIIAVVLTSLLFGVAHTEQGTIGVVVTTLDAVFFSLTRLKFSDNLWAPVLAHGFNNSIGLIAFFFIGPIYGLW
ncbi:MAG: type II CAAX endopeptidase family protein [Methanomassiliicoccus sp.]|nr:type II CAAX endopeptidase family protein [Methanomassiliicoccus sp.]